MMRGWDVIVDGKVVDTVFFIDDMEDWEVRDSLILEGEYGNILRVRESK